MKNLPLLQKHSYPTQLLQPRIASEELVVPSSDAATSLYYGVDAFSPTLVDFHTVDQKRIIWSSRAHRKMMGTLHLAWVGRPWKLRSQSFWASMFAIVAHVLFIAGCIGEVMAQDRKVKSFHASIDHPLLVGACCYLMWHVLGYIEVINSCHNLEIWLEEYFHGRQPQVQRRWLAFFPDRVDFWAEVLGIVGSLLYIISRLVVISRDVNRKDFGVIDVSRSDLGLILGYWVPFFAGSMFLLVGAYFAHVEVMHQWFTWRLRTIEGWVTGFNLLATLGFFLSSTLQFIDPFSALLGFTDCMTPFAFGSICGLCSAMLSVIELQMVHKRHNHPEYGILKNPSGYGSLA